MLISSTALCDTKTFIAHCFVHKQVLPTGRIFGRKVQKRPNKKQSGRTTNLRPSFGLFFVQKGRKGAELLESLFSYYSLLSIIIIVKSKNYCTFPTDIEKYGFVSKGKMPSIREIYQGAEFFPQRPNFSADLAGKVCQELATLCRGCQFHDWPDKHDAEVICVSIKLFALNTYTARAWTMIHVGFHCCALRETNLCARD